MDELSCALVDDSLFEIGGGLPSRVQFVKVLYVADDDVRGVIFHGGNNPHDDVMGPMDGDERKIYCLATYMGNNGTQNLPHKVIAQYENDDLKSLSVASEGRLPQNTLIKVRDVVRTLEAQGKINRYSTICHLVSRVGANTTQHPIHDIYQ